MADETVIKITLDAEGAVKGYQDLGTAQDQLKTGAAGVEGALITNQSALKGLGIALGAAAAAAAAAGAAIAGVVAAGVKGAEINDVADSFGTFATKAGAVADVFKGQLREATAGTINDFELMKGAVEGLRAGIRPDEMITLTKAARVLAEETGGDLKESLDLVTNSVLTGRDALLRKNGIVIDSAKAEATLAASLGTTADKLSETGKLAAAQAEIIRQLGEKAKGAADIQDDLGDKVAKVGTALDNQKNAFFTSIANNVALQGAVEDVATTIKNLNFKPIIEGLSAIITFSSEAVSVVLSVASAIKQLPTGTGFLSNAFKGLEIADSTGFLKRFGDSMRAIDTGNAAVAVFGKSLDRLGSIYGSTGKGAKTYPDFLEKAAKAIEDARKKAEALTKGWIDNTKVQKAAGEASKDLSEKLKDEQDALEKVAREIAEANSPQGLLKYADNIKQTEDAANKLGFGEKELAEAIEYQRQKAAEAGVDLTKLDAAMLAIKDSAAKASTEVQDLGNSIGSDLQKSITQIGIDGLGDLLSVGLKGGTKEDFKKVAQGIAGAIGGAIGLAIGAYFGGPAGAAVGSAVGSAIGSSLGDVDTGDIRGWSDDFWDSMAKYFGKGAAQFYKYYSGAIIIDKLFSEDSAGTSYRKKVDKFFAEAFNHDRILAVVNGELRQITDLDFGAGEFATQDPSSHFYDIFNGMSDAAKAGFDSIALGFTTLLGQGTEFATGLAAVFTNNIGGSLNNLQLLVQASGVSFDQLRESVVNAFLDGQVSALQAQTALNGIAQVAQKGIPDGIGFVTEAFDNLRNAGTKGGRALIDALQDIGFEAQELKIKDFAQLEAYLKQKMPENAAAISQLFEALRSTGVDSIDELTAATAEELLPALSQLESVNFPFKEATADAEKLLDMVSNLPEVIHSRIELDVHTNYDANTQELARNGYLPPQIPGPRNEGNGA